MKYKCSVSNILLSEEGKSTTNGLFLVWNNLISIHSLNSVDVFWANITRNVVVTTEKNGFPRYAGTDRQTDKGTGRQIDRQTTHTHTHTHTHTCTHTHTHTHTEGRQHCQRSDDVVMEATTSSSGKRRRHRQGNGDVIVRVTATSSQ